jgi:putative spermidine/putrescine transport system ATP-binding protein
MNLYQTVAYGLRARKTPKADTRDRVAQALDLVQLGGLEKRPVTDLSGGQQQRVALARAIAVHPRILLLDEPLSNLDAELRYATRRQLAELQQRLKITAIYVTHDQEEALELAHRIAVMRDGVVEQVGTPSEILNAPATPFVEAFLERQRQSLRR